jgi:hypothetical protein
LVFRQGSMKLAGWSDRMEYYQERELIFPSAF